MINEKLLEGDLVSLLPINEDAESSNINPLRVIKTSGNEVEVEGVGVLDKSLLFPIPLTTPILYKNTYDEVLNSYHVYHTNGFVQYNITECIAIKYYEDRNIFLYEGLPLKYVHQLHQLLNIISIPKEIII